MTIHGQRHRCAAAMPHNMITNRFPAGQRSGQPTDRDVRLFRRPSHNGGLNGLEMVDRAILLCYDGRLLALIGRVAQQRKSSHRSSLDGKAQV